MHKKKITIDTVSKYYNSTPVLYNIDLTLEEGYIYGLIGKNGSGKSALCSLLSTVSTPDIGAVNYFSHIVTSNDLSDLSKIRQHIGYVPQDPYMPLELTVFEFLSYAAGCRGLSGDELIIAVEESMEYTKISSFQNCVISNLSKGIIKRVAISSAIVSDPYFLVMDSVFDTMDSEGILLIKEIIRKRSGGEYITLISSSNTNELEDICDKTVMISSGSIQASSIFSNLKERR